MNYFEICFYDINNFLNFYVLLLLLLIKDLFQKNDYFCYTFEAQSEDPSISLDFNSKQFQNIYALLFFNATNCEI